MKASMRHLGLVSGFAMLSLFGFSSNAKAADTTTVTVVISNVCQFVGVPTGTSQSVSDAASIVTAGASQNIVVQCNGLNGFKVTAVSAKGSVLDDGNTTDTYKIPYKVTTTAGTSNAVSLASSASLVTAAPGTTLGNTSAYSSTCAAATGCTIGFSYALTPPPALPAGTYTDTITYSVAPN